MGYGFGSWGFGRMHDSKKLVLGSGLVPDPKLEILMTVLVILK